MRDDIPTYLFSELSEVFFETDKIESIFPDGIDAAFIDGDHRFEFALKDFINIEKYSNSKTIVLIHDCCPTNIQMASRDRRRFMRTDFASMGRWTGDGWKLLPILSFYRPDLTVIPLDCPPTGLLLVTNLDNCSNSLNQNYEDIVQKFKSLKLNLIDHRKSFPLTSSRNVKFEERI